MQQKNGKLLGIFSLILAFGAIVTGVMMIDSNYGIFKEYPKEWLNITPFDSWYIPGITAIILFGIGNIIAAIFSFRKGNSMPWLLTAIMGGILFLTAVTQVMLLGKWYLATIEIMMLSIIQLALSGYTFIKRGPIKRSFSNREKC